MPQRYLSSSHCWQHGDLRLVRRDDFPGRVRTSAGRALFDGGRSQQPVPSLAPHVMPVHPDFVVMMPGPMSRNPNIVDRTDVVARPVNIIRPVTHCNVHNHGVGSRKHRCEHCHKYSHFQFHSYNFCIGSRRPMDGFYCSSVPDILSQAASSNIGFA